MCLNERKEVRSGNGLIDGRNMPEKSMGRNMGNGLTCKHRAQNFDMNETRVRL